MHSQRMNFYHSLILNANVFELHEMQMFVEKNVLTVKSVIQLFRLRLRSNPEASVCQIACVWRAVGQCFDWGWVAVCGRQRGSLTDTCNTG